ELLYFMTYLFFVYAVDIQTDIHINVLFLNLFYVKITLFNKDKMLEKVLKIKDFYPLLRCSNTTHSTCLEWAKKMSHPTGIPLAEAHISETVAWIGYFSLIWCLLLRYNPSNCKQ
ncbi:TPA: hypothetical protein ACGOZO_002080, partial [Streptococcus suis]